MQRYPLACKQTRGAVDVIGGRGMVKSFDLQAVIFIPCAGTHV
jgi:hypothetical protein